MGRLSEGTRLLRRPPPSSPPAAAGGSAIARCADLCLNVAWRLALVVACGDAFLGLAMQAVLSGGLGELAPETSWVGGVSEVHAR